MQEYHFPSMAGHPDGTSLEPLQAEGKLPGTYLALFLAASASLASLCATDRWRTGCSATSCCSCCCCAACTTRMLCAADTTSSLSYLSGWSVRQQQSPPPTGARAACHAWCDIACVTAGRFASYAGAPARGGAVACAASVTE